MSLQTILYIIGSLLTGFGGGAVTHSEHHKAVATPCPCIETPTPTAVTK